jgi:hypothetical protein
MDDSPHATPAPIPLRAARLLILCDNPFIFLSSPSADLQELIPTVRSFYFPRIVLMLNASHRERRLATKAVMRR